MTDFNDDEYDPTQPMAVETSVRPYQDTLSANQVKLLMAYQEYEALIQQGVDDEELGALKQIEGAWRIYHNQLWKYAVSDVTGQKYRKQEEWVTECIEQRHKGRLFSRTNFFSIMKSVSIGLGLGLEYQDALRLGLSHNAVDEMNNSGAMQVTQVLDGKKKTLVPTFTALGQEKLLGGGLKTPKELAKDLASMTPADAVKTVRHAVGRKYTYCSAAIRYAGNTPLFDESKAHVFACEFTFVDPDNGSTPYQGIVKLEGDMPDKVVEEVMRKLKGDFTL